MMRKVITQNGKTDKTWTMMRKTARTMKGIARKSGNDAGDYNQYQEWQETKLEELAFLQRKNKDDETRIEVKNEEGCGRTSTWRKTKFKGARTMRRDNKISRKMG